MSGFDPVAATAVYMATLSPAAHAKATAYTQGGHWLLLWGWAVSVLAAWIITRTGLLARVEERVEQKRPHPILASFLVSLAFIALDALLELPWSIYAQWFREKSYGLTSQPFGGWLMEDLIGSLISAVFVSVFLVALYALIRRTPRTWWIWAGGLAAVGVSFLVLIGPIIIDPIFNKYTPAPPGAVRDAVVQLAKSAGVPYDKIYIFNGSKQSNRYTANVSGLGASARVAMSDVMFTKGADLAEVRGVVGHEMGHYRHNHVVWTALILGLVAMVMFAVIQLVFPFVRRWFGADVDSIADPAGLPVIMAILATLILIDTPLNNILTRSEEADADSFSLHYANEPDGLSKALVKTIEYRASSPSDLEEILFYDHPSVEHRVRKAMDWKATHPPS